MNGLKVIAWVLIILQIISVFGNLINGGSIFKLSFENIYVFLNDFAWTLGYYATGILGLILLHLEKRATARYYSKPSNNKQNFSLTASNAEETNNVVLSYKTRNRYKRILQKEKAKKFFISSIVSATLGFVLLFWIYISEQYFSIGVFCFFLILTVALFSAACVYYFLSKKLY